MWRYIYEGAYTMGQINGVGAETLPTGERYEGEFVNGVRQGKGRMVYTDGAEKFPGHAATFEALIERLDSLAAPNATSNSLRWELTGLLRGKPSPTKPTARSPNTSGSMKMLTWP